MHVETVVAVALQVRRVSVPDAPVTVAVWVPPGWNVPRSVVTDTGPPCVSVTVMVTVFVMSWAASLRVRRGAGAVRRRGDAVFTRASGRPSTWVFTVSAFHPGRTRPAGQVHRRRGM